MHHSIELSVPTDATDDLLAALAEHEGVLSVERGAAVKLPGDVVTVHALNLSVDAVLAEARHAYAHGPTAVVTSGVDSFIVTGAQNAIEDDADESPWEEFERTLRHNGRLSINYFLLMALGGGIAIAGLLSPPVPQTLVGAAGAVAGLAIITSYRHAVLAGALIALALVPAAALAGAGAVSGDMVLLLGGLKRTAVDMALVIVLGGAVILVKDRLVHRHRMPLA